MERRDRHDLLNLTVKEGDAIVHVHLAWTAGPKEVITEEYVRECARAALDQMRVPV